MYDSFPSSARTATVWVRSQAQWLMQNNLIQCVYSWSFMQYKLCAMLVWKMSEKIQCVAFHFFLQAIYYLSIVHVFKLSFYYVIQTWHITLNIRRLSEIFSFFVFQFKISVYFLYK